MFITLLIVTFAIAFVVSSLVVLMFNKPLNSILSRIISDSIYTAWSKYLRFAIYVTGISSGVRIYALEKYITRPGYEGSEIVILNTERWVLEVYRTVIGTLQGGCMDAAGVLYLRADRIRDNTCVRDETNRQKRELRNRRYEQLILRQALRLKP